MAELVKRWYCVRAISGQETKVEGYIKQEIRKILKERNELALKKGDAPVHVPADEELNNTVLVPKDKVVQLNSKGKKTVKERPMFSGYIMVELALDGEFTHAIKGIPGVVGFLTDKPGGDPIPLRKADVNLMLHRVDEQAEVSEQTIIPFVVGEAVKVIEGPFNGFDGIVEEVKADKRKLVVEVKIFGRKTPLELGFNQVDKV